MPGFTEIFGGGTIYPSEPTYLSINMSDDVTLEWPIEQAVSGDIVAKIIDVTASVAGLTITIPDARQVSTGYTALFNNVGAETVTVVTATGGTIISLSSGTAWTIYLRDNSTEAGSWRTFQQGASTSVADAAALAGAGLVAILTTLNLNWPVTSRNANYVILDSDRARVNEWIGGSGTFTMPDAGTVGNGWFTIVKNLGSGDLTVATVSGNTIDDLASLTVSAGESCFLDSDGTDYFTIGRSGSTSSSSFQFIEIDVSGSGTYTLSGSELNKIGYRFIGVLSGTRNVVVPTAVQEYWVNNETTGAFSLFVKTAGQVIGIEILQGDSNILYCDGTDVVSAESSTVSFPIVISQGGTGATTAATARTNLGGTATGVAVFTAASAAAALSATGGAAAALTLTAGVGLTGGGDLSANRTFTVDSTVVPLLALSNVFTAVGVSTAGVQVSSTLPAVALNETDAAANNRFWYMAVTSEAFVLGVENDAHSVGTNFLQVDRTGTTIDTVNFGSGTLQYGGSEVGLRDIPQNSQSSSYTIVLADRGKDILHPTGGGAGDAYTIPANATTAFPTGSVVMFTNLDSNAITIAPAGGVVLILAGSSSTGSRSITGNGTATVRKMGTDTWLMTGVGIL
jgi:hypothetical protein